MITYIYYALDRFSVFKLQINTAKSPVFWVTLDNCGTNNEKNMPPFWSLCPSPIPRVITPHYCPPAHSGKSDDLPLALFFSVLWLINKCLANSSQQTVALTYWDCRKRFWGFCLPFVNITRVFRVLC